MPQWNCSLLLGLILLSPVVAQERVWNDNTGNFSVKAELVQVADQVIQLKRTEDGKMVWVPLARMSQTDRLFIANLNAEEVPGQHSATNSTEVDPAANVDSAEKRSVTRTESTGNDYRSPETVVAESDSSYPRPTDRANTTGSIIVESKSASVAEPRATPLLEPAVDPSKKRTAAKSRPAEPAKSVVLIFAVPKLQPPLLPVDYQAEIHPTDYLADTGPPLPPKMLPSISKSNIPALDSKDRMVSAGTQPANPSSLPKLSKARLPQPIRSAVPASTTKARKNIEVSSRTSSEMFVSPTNTSNIVLDINKTVAELTTQQIIDEIQLSAQLKWNQAAALSQSLEPLPNNLDLVVQANSPLLNTVSKFGHLKLEKFENEKGEAFDVKRMPRSVSNPLNNWIPFQSGSQAYASGIRSVSITVSLQRPELIPARAQEICGAFRIFLVTRQRELTFYEVVGRTGKIDHPILRERGISMRVSNPDLQTFVVEVDKGRSTVSSVELLSARTNIGSNQMTTSRAAIYQFNSIGAIPESASLKITLTEDGRDLSIPFRFQNVQLPAEVVSAETSP